MGWYEAVKCMRYLMVSQSTPRESLGGSELYVRRLSDALLARGVDVFWVHYTEGDPGRDRGEKRSDCIQYYLIAARHHAYTRDHAWRMDPIGLDQFREVLTDVQPDCVHFHGFGRNQSPEHLADAKRSGATVLMTYHAPGQSCPRWDLLYKNRELCSGKIEVSRCTDCALHRLGVPAPARDLFARIDLSPLAHILPYSVQHPLVRRKGVMDYQRRWAQGMDVPDRILWHAEWVRDLLLLNGIPEDRLYHLPLPPPRPPAHVPSVDPRDSGTRRFVFIGRLVDIKGIHVITHAVSLLPSNEQVEVQIVGAKGPEEYLRRIVRECASDSRLCLVPPVEFDEIPALIRNSDAVIVPSLWPETGPYTVLEALWTGTPVIGSDRAGIRELLGKWGGGVLFEPGNARQLARLFVECDFHAMRRDPVAFQSNWTSEFEKRLSALCTLVQGRSSFHICSQASAT